MTDAPKKPRSSRPYVFDIYRQGGEWRWRLWAKNGKIVANGGESFKRRAWAIKTCDNMTDGLEKSTVFVEGVELE